MFLGLFNNYVKANGDAESAVQLALGEVEPDSQRHALDARKATHRAVLDWVYTRTVTPEQDPHSSG
ncbi:hypothetical protein ACWDWO_14875 [Actinopolymorpha singaporensis]